MRRPRPAHPDRAQRDAAVAQARQFDNVVAVGQPIPYHDVAAFWIGQWRQGAPDALMPQIDFASLQIYPFLETGRWDWRQTTVAAGPARAQAMMDAALAYVQALHRWARRAAYRSSASGATAHPAASMPLVIGETGWKARQTNPAHAIEAHAARPANQKGFVDLLRAWELSAGGTTAYHFSAFDEAWKGSDDGWGLWSDTRQPRYALCGLAVPAAPACRPDLYEGAGHFVD